MIEVKVRRASEQGREQKVVFSVENRIEEFKETRMLGVAVHSVRPSGPGEMFILVLSAVFGLMGGVMLVFVAEFMEKVKEQDT